MSLVVMALAGSVLAAERKPPATERKPAIERATEAQAHYELGVFYHERMFADLDLAISEYEKAIKLKDEFAQAHYHLGLSYHTKAKLGVDEKALYRKALTQYRRYLKLAPKGQLAQKARQNIKAVQARLR